MPIDTRKVINNPYSLKFAYLLGKYTPYWLGYRIALFLGDRVSSRKNSKLVQTVRCNQWVVSGCNADKQCLDERVAENLRNVAVSTYDFYRTLNSPAEALRLIEPHPMALQLVRRPEFADRGLIITGIHMSNFEMIFHLSGLADVKALSLTTPVLSSAYQKQLDMRKQIGINVVPTSMSTIKQAISHLRAGGVVITAIDWPDDSLSYRPTFFGLPAVLPIHHIFIALKADVPIVVAAIYRKPDGKYYFFFSEPIEMQHHPDREKEILLNAENILHIAEGYIQNYPTQWSMSFPVWPEVMDKVPY